MEDISASSGNNPQLELSFKSAKSIGAIAAHLQVKRDFNALLCIGFRV
jgi:hypothetical protein